MAARPKKSTPETSSTVLMVRPGRSIQWPDGTRRGVGAHRKQVGHVTTNGERRTRVVDQPAYTVSVDDPFIQPYMHNLEPAEAGAKPVPQSNWPKRWQAVANERAVKAKPDRRSRAQRERDMELSIEAASDSDEIPDPVGDDELEPGDGEPEDMVGSGAAKGRAKSKATT